MASSSSSSHTNQFANYNARPAARIASNSSSGSSSSASYSHNNNNSSNTINKLWSTADMPEPFTPEMRDLQARGKDPYSNAGHLGANGGGRATTAMHHGHGGLRMGGGSGSRQQQQQQQQQHNQQQQQQRPKEPFQKTERRDWAETVLDNPELLLMYAQSSGDTLPATRHKFKKIMCGLDYDDEDDDASVAGGAQYQQHHQQQPSRYDAASGWGRFGEDGGPRGGRR